jgi:dihydropteroate synthase
MNTQASTMWQTSRFALDLARPRVMGIVNLTPDSFFDGGRYFAEADPRPALARCEQLLEEGADLLDLGAESTRPGATPLPLEQEQARLLPVLREAVRLGVPISVDTYKPGVMQAALDAGADVINDIWALRQPGAVQVVASHPACGVCLMHMHGEPRTMQIQPMAGEALAPVRAFLREAAARLEASGVGRHRILLDPGVGFGKTVAQNFSLLACQQELLSLGYPLMAAWSRKSSLGAVLGAPGQPAPEAQRVTASVAAALLAVERGARVLRVHDVRPTVEALKVWQACREQA